MLTKEEIFRLYHCQENDEKDALFGLLLCVKAHIAIVNLSLDPVDSEAIKKSTDDLDEYITPILNLLEETLKEEAQK